MRTSCKVCLCGLLAGAVFGCEAELEDVARNGVLTAPLAEKNPPESSSVVVRGQDELLRRVEERKRASAAFAASVDGVHAGFGSGLRAEVEQRTWRETDACANEIVSPAEAERTSRPSDGIVVSGESSTPRSLRERLQAGVRASDLESPGGDDSAVPKDAPVFGPFRF